jgi:hypothetical protein
LLIHTSTLHVQHVSNKVAKLQSSDNSSQSELVPLRFNLIKLEQEKELLSKHLAFVEGELATRSDELLRVRSAKSSKIVELEGELNTARDERLQLQKHVCLCLFV